MDPVAETIKAYDEKAQEFQERYIKDGNVNSMQPWLDGFVELLPAPAKVLEIGSGAGFDAKYLSEKGLEVTSIDLSEGFLKIARKVAPQVKFIQMDMCSLDFAPSEFDGIWASSTLLHLPKKDLQPVLEKIKNVLKPGGIFYANLKQGEGEEFVTNKGEGNLAGAKRYFAYYTKEEFTEMLRANGFELVRYGTAEMRNNHWLHFYSKK